MIHPPPLRDVLRQQADHLGSAPALRIDADVLSYADVWDAARRTAARLHRLGVEPGDTVACLAGNRRATVATWFGCIALGAVFLPVNPLLRHGPLRTVLGHASPSLVVVDPAAVGESVAVVVGETPWTIVTCDDLDVAIEHDDGADVPHDDARDPLARAKLMYTSGTTGQPKGVVWSAACEAEHGRAYADEMIPIDVGENVYCCLPLSHVTCQGTVLGTLIRGGCITVDSTFDAFGFWNRMRTLDVVQFTYVGTVLSVLERRRPRPDDHDNPVRRVLGAAAPGDRWRSFEERFGVEIVDVWGQTETASCWTLPTTMPQTPGTLGAPVDRWEARIVAVDDDGRPGDDLTEPGAVGELWMRPTRAGVLFDGYLATDGSVDRSCFDAEGWYRTGDLMHRTDDGALVFRGRIREAIRRRGEMIAAGEVESAALAVDGVSEAAAVGVRADDGVEQEIKLCVVPNAGASVDPAELWAALRASLPRFMVPRYIDVRLELPKTPSTRVRKALLSDEGTASAWDARRRP